MDALWMLHFNKTPSKHIMYRRSTSDIHIGAAQFIIHEQFPEIGGLQNTVILVAGKLKLIKPQTPTSLQILATCRWQDRTLDCIVYNGLC